MPKTLVSDAIPGDLNMLRACLWDAVTAAHSCLRARKHDDRLRAVHALSQAGNAYRALLETADLERRISALEAAKEGQE